MSSLKDKVAKIRGSFSMIVNGDELCTVAKAVNKNAAVLQELIEKVEKLEKKVKEE